MANSQEQLKYLRDMLKRKAESSQYDSFVNPNDTNDFSDFDSGDDISQMAKIQTDFEFKNNNEPNTNEQPETPEDTINWWKKTVNSIEYARGNVVEGVLNVFDFLFDAQTTIMGLYGKIFGIDDTWAKNLIEYDWQSQASNADRLLSQNNLLNGDVFTKEYWEKWKDLSSPEKSREDIKQTKQDSLIVYGSDNFQEKFDNISIGVGEMLPSIVAAIATGGQSLVAQAAIQGGLAAAEGFGASTSQAIKEGASFSNAAKYGAVKGAINGAIVAATVGIGGNVATKASGTMTGKISQSVGERIFNLTGSKAAEVFAGQATKIAIQSGVAASRAALNTAIDPAIREIYDSNAIENAYGNSEAIQQTMNRIKNASECAAITSAVIGTAREVGGFVFRGKDGYEANYYTQQMSELQNKLNKELKSFNDDLVNGKLDPNSSEAINRFNNIKNISSKIENIGSKAAESFQKLYDNSKITIKNKNGETIYDGVVGNEETPEFKMDFGVNKDVADRVKNIINNKMFTDEIINRASGVFDGENFTTDFKGNKNFNAKLTYNAKNDETSVIVDNGNGSTNLPSQIIDGNLVIKPKANDITTALVFLKNQELNDDNVLQVEINTKELGLGDYLPQKNLIFTKKTINDLSNGNITVGFRKISTLFKQIDEKTNQPVIKYANNINDIEAQKAFKDNKGGGIANIYTKGKNAILFGFGGGNNIVIEFDVVSGKVSNVDFVAPKDTSSYLSSKYQNGYKKFNRYTIKTKPLAKIEDLKENEEFVKNGVHYVYDGIKNDIVEYHEKNNVDSTVKQGLSFFKKSIESGEISKATKVEVNYIYDKKAKTSSKTNNKPATKENKGTESKPIESKKNIVSDKKNVLKTRATNNNKQVEITKAETKKVEEPKKTYKTTIRKVFKLTDIGKKGTEIGNTQWDTPKGKLFVYEKDGSIFADLKNNEKFRYKDIYKFENVTELNKWLKGQKAIKTRVARETEKNGKTTTYKDKPKRFVSLEKTKESVSAAKKGEYYVYKKAEKGKGNNFSYDKITGKVFEYDGEKFGYKKVDKEYIVTELSTGLPVNSKTLLGKVGFTSLKSIDDVINFMYVAQNSIKNAFNGNKNTIDAQAELAKYIKFIDTIEEDSKQLNDENHSPEGIKKQQDLVDKAVEELKSGKGRKVKIDKNGSIVLETKNEQNNVKTSTKDSQGNQLTEEQQEYFRDSKVRDENGNLLVVYHGSNAKFTTFDKKKIGENTQAKIKGIYLATSYDMAYQSGDNIIKGYANITKPINTESLTISDSQIKQLVSSIEKLQKIDLDNAVKAIKQECKTDYEVIEYLQSASNDVSLFNEAITKITGYDGAKLDTNNYGKVYIAFESNQIKSIDNKKPTSNPDILEKQEEKQELWDKKIYIDDRKNDGLFYEEKLQYYNKQLLKYGIDYRNNDIYIEYTEKLKTAKNNQVASRFQNKILNKLDSLLYEAEKGTGKKPMSLTGTTIEDAKKIADGVAKNATPEVVNKDIQEIRNLWDRTIKQEQDALHSVEKPDNFEFRQKRLKKVIKLFREKYDLTDSKKFKEFLKIKPTNEKHIKDETIKYELQIREELAQDDKVYESNAFVEKQSALEPENIPLKLVKEYGEWNRDRIISFSDAKSIVKTLSLIVANQFDLNEVSEVKVYIKREKAAQKLYQILMSEEEKNFNDALEQFIDEFANTEIKYVSKDKKEHILVNYNTLNRDEIKSILKEQIRLMVIARSKISKKTKVINEINRLNELNKELKLALKELKLIKDLEVKLRPQIDRIKESIGESYKITDDSIARDGLDFMLKPFAELKYANGRGYTEKGLKENIDEVLNYYTEDIIDKYEKIDYDDELRTSLEMLRDELNEPSYSYKRNENGGYDLDENGDRIVKSATYRTLSSNMLIEIRNIISMINGLNLKARQRFVEENKPYAINTVDALGSFERKDGFLAKTFDNYVRAFAPAYVVIERLLNGSSLADVIIKEGQQARNDKLMFVGQNKAKIYDKLKELKIINKFGKKVNINGNDITLGDAMSLYITLNVDANFEAANDSGIKYYDDNGRLKELAKPNEASKLKEVVKATLPEEFVKMANYLLDFMNNEMKESYIKWYEGRFGSYNRRNEIGKIKENSYWVLLREKKMPKNIEKMVKVPVGIFKNAQTRIKNNNAVIITDALSTVLSYIDSIADELYIKPVYRKIKSVQATMGENGKTVYQVMREKLTNREMEYIDKTLEDMLGKKMDNRDFFTALMSRFSVAKLSLNLGSTLKQYASIYTSNLPLRYSTKGLFERIFGNGSVKKEYSELVDEIGGLKYRNADGSAILTANASDFTKTTETIAKYGMKPITVMDSFTISVGVYSLMIIAKNEYGYEYGSEENKNWVKEHWIEFELSQIGGGALSKSAVRRGDYGSITKALFGFLQGANIANLGSQLHKIGLYSRNKNVDENELEAQYNEAKGTTKQAKKEMDNARKEYDDMMNRYHEGKNSSTKEERQNAKQRVNDTEQEYSKAKANEEAFEHKKADYDSYKNAGGKKIPIHIVSGLIAQGLFVALVNELVKRIKGKKDWDDWDIKELGTELLLDVNVSWIPLINDISGILQGYEMSVPAVDVLNKAVDIINNGKGKDWKSMARELALLIGDSTGIPFENIFDYIYGSVKAFDPEAAYKLRSLLYNSSIQSATKTLNNYAKKGNQRKTASMISAIMDKYKAENSSDELDNELAKLYIDGYNTLPKNYLVSYNDNDGNAVELTKEQINAFKAEYNKANAQVEKLMQLTDYKTKTSEDKSKLIKKIYDTYYSYAKAKVLKQEKADSKLSTLLLYSNGKMNVSKFINYLGIISNITESKSKTRKELVFAYVNRLSLSKNEKLLLLYLAGYSSQSSNKSLTNYLRGLGLSGKKVNTFLGVE